MASKTALKAAREALTANQFQLAVQHCQEVLGQDPTNYNALIFLGKAQAELGKVPESEQAYKQAIQAAPDQALAYLGLTSLFEKHGSVSQRLASLNDLRLCLLKSGSDEKKLVEILLKLVEILPRAKPSEALPVWRALLEDARVISNENSSFPSLFDIWGQIVAASEQDERARIDKAVESERKSIRHTGSVSDLTRLLQAREQAAVLLEENWRQWCASAKTDDQVQKSTVSFIQRLTSRIAVALENKSELRQELISTCENYVALVIKSAPTTVVSEPFETLLDAHLITKGPFDQHTQTLLRQYQQFFSASSTATSQAIDTLVQPQTQSQVSDIVQANSTKLLPAIAIAEISFRRRLWEDCLKALETVRTHALGSFDTTVSPLEALTSSGLMQYASLRLAWCLFYNNTTQRDQVLQLFRDLLTLAPSPSTNSFIVSARIGLVRTLAEMGAVEEALQTLSPLIESPPATYDPVITGLGLGAVQSEHGWLLILLGQQEQALAKLQEAAAIDPNDALIQHRIGRLYWLMGGDYRSNKGLCQTSLLKSVQLDNALAANYTYLGHYYSALQDVIRARKCYQKAVVLDASRETEALQALADILVDAGENADARALYEQIVSIIPTSVWAHKRYGLHILVHDGDVVAAQNAFQAALRLKHDDPECLEALAECYSRQGKYLASLKAYQRRIELASPNDNCIEARLQMALIKHKIGLDDQAIEDYHVVHSQATATPLSLKCLADAQLSHSRFLFSQGRFGAAVVALNDALNAVTNAFRIDAQLTTMHCWWKLAGDVLMSLAQLPYHLSSSQTNNELAELSNHVKSLQSTRSAWPLARTALTTPALTKDANENVAGTSAGVLVAAEAVLALCCDCFAAALVTLPQRLQAHASIIWADLGLALIHRVLNVCKKSTNTAEVKALLQLAAKAYSEAIRRNQKNGSFWNGLGVVALLQTAVVSSTNEDRSSSTALSQHALIQAIHHAPKHASAWSNLGLLYLINDDVELANKAFAHAQMIDPDLSECWVGQSLIAERVGSEETIELFKHCFDLANGTQLDINFRLATLLFHHVVDEYKEGKPSSREQSTDISTALFAAQKLIELDPGDAAAMNLFGLLLEWRGLHSSSVDAFHRARAIIADRKPSQAQAEDLTKIDENLGRAEWACGDAAVAVVTLDRALAAEPDLTLQIAPRVLTALTSGLARFAAADLHGALARFEQALSLCNEKDKEGDLRGRVVLLLCQVLYALEGQQQRTLARDEMLNLVKSKPHFVQALLFLAAFGLSVGQMNIAGAALDDIDRLPLDVWQAQDPNGQYFALLAQYHILQNDIVSAERVLNRAIHRLPWLSVHWLRLSSFLLQQRPATGAAQSIALARTALRLSPETNDVASRWLIYGQAILAAGLTPSLAAASSVEQATVVPLQLSIQAGRAFQKSILMNPQSMTAWAMTACELRSRVALVIATEQQNYDLLSLASTAESVLRNVDAVCTQPSKDRSSEKSRTVLVLHGRLALAEWKLWQSQVDKNRQSALIQEAYALSTQIVQICQEQGDKTLLALSLLQSGRALVQNGDLVSAIRVFLTSLEENPSDPAAWQDLAIAYASGGDPATAAQALMQALERSNKAYVHHGFIHVQLARLAFLIGDHATVLSQVNEALENYPTSTTGIDTDLIARWWQVMGMLQREASETGPKAMTRTLKALQLLAARNPTWPGLDKVQQRINAARAASA